jgi:carboxymethylenebutenolidase
MALGLALATAPAAAKRNVPPDAAGAKAALDSSPRTSEWVEIAYRGDTRIRSFVVYPGRTLGAPVVVVIHETDGLTDWVRAVGDHLAANGFIAVVPDLVSGLGSESEGIDSPRSQDDVVELLGGMSVDEVNQRLDAVRLFALQMPAANGGIATMGFGWGGARSFGYAAHQPAVDAAIVFYGPSPDPEALERIEARVLGLYGGDDDEVNATLAPAAKKMKSLRRTYEAEVYDSASRGFLRDHAGGGGANGKAAEKAWKRAMKFLREALADNPF